MMGNVVILHATTIRRLSAPIFAPEDGEREALPQGALTDAKIDEVTARLAAEAIARFHPTREARLRAGEGYLSRLFSEPIQWTHDLERKLNMRRAFVTRLERA